MIEVSFPTCSVKHYNPGRVWIAYLCRRLLKYLYFADQHFYTPLCPWSRSRDGSLPQACLCWFLSRSNFLQGVECTRHGLLSTCTPPPILHSPKQISLQLCPSCAPGHLLLYLKCFHPIPPAQLVLRVAFLGSA